jgi:hypothetical protein
LDDKVTVTQLLIELIQEYLNQKIRISEFINKYEEIYLNNISTELDDFLVFENIYDLMNYYESNSQIRQESRNFLDEEKFKEKLQNLISSSQLS